jgi:hypothetical protein
MPVEYREVRTCDNCGGPDPKVRQAVDVVSTHEALLCDKDTCWGAVVRIFSNGKVTAGGTVKGFASLAFLTDPA